MRQPKRRQPSSYADTPHLASGFPTMDILPAKQNSHRFRMAVPMASHWPPELVFPSFRVVGCSVSFCLCRPPGAICSRTAGFPCIGTAIKQHLSARSSRRAIEQLQCQTAINLFCFTYKGSGTRQSLIPDLGGVQSTKFGRLDPLPRPGMAVDPAS